VDPRGDAEAIRQIRQRLNDVRTTQNRPTVGLVLSGGGAKGAAEVGALKYIEELGIPIDFVCGTSIGGLVGGIYAMGYTASDLETLFRTQDWNVMLTDRIPTRYIPYEAKKDRATYLLTIPFSMPIKHGAREKADTSQVDFAMHGNRERMRLQRQLPSDPQTPASLVSSLPSGYAYGFNVNNLLSSMSVGYQDDISFRDLPTPYICVAGDVVSSRAKYWGSGSITTAMRSTMSIPGLFDPVRTGRMVLVDGGTRNNFPTDVAKAVGADYLIGIELSDAEPDYYEVNNLGDILGQFITMLGKDSFTKNVGKTDAFIKPDLAGYNMLSFNKEAVDTMLQRGYRAAVGQHDALVAIREKTGTDPSPRPFPPAVDISRTPVQLASISYEGVTDQESQRLARLTGLDIRTPLDKKTIDEAMCRIQATGAFESVTYSLYGSEGPYRLVFHCNRAPVNHFGVGLRADSEEGASLIFAVGLGTRRLAGSKLDFTVRLGQNSRTSLHYALDLRNLPTLNFTVTGARYRGNLGTRSDDLKYDVAYTTLREDFYISGMNWTRLDLRAGFTHKGYALNPNTVFAQQMAESGSTLSDNYFGAYLLGGLYTLDAPYFPKRGIYLDARADYDFVSPSQPAFTPVLTSRLDFKAAIPVGQRATFLPDIRLRNVYHFGEKAHDGLIHTNFAGGRLAGRYIEDQIPFFGFDHVYMLGDLVANAVAELRFNPFRNLYVSTLGGVIITDDKLIEMVKHPLPDVYAFGAEAAYDTIVGPVRLSVHWSNAFHWGAHVSLGFDF
jgi:NTE family protein